MKRSDLIQQLNISATEFNKLATERQVGLKDEYTDEEVGVLKQSTIVRPAKKGSKKPSTPGDAGLTLRETIDAGLEQKQQVISKAAAEGKSLAVTEVVTRLSAYVETKAQLEEQFWQLLSVPQDEALGQIDGIEAGEVDVEDFFAGALKALQKAS
jgi:hypothetical protein